MRTAPRLAARDGVSLAAVTVTLLLAALACGLAALWLAGPAQAAPGAVVWKRTPDPTGGPDRLTLCARGPAGSLYAAGMAGSNKGDIWITRYRAGGSVMWTRRWDDARHKMDIARAMTVDAAGNVYVCGYVDGTASVTDSVVLKYGPTGRKKWAQVKRFGGFEEATAIAVDASGNAYVTGQEQPAEGRSTLYVAKFLSGDGAVAWTWFQDTPETNSSGLAIAVTGTGTCYVAGTIISVGAPYSDGYLVRVTGGGRDWEQVWDGPAAKADWWQGVALAPAGGVVVGGSTGLSGPGDLAAARFSETGERTWAGTWDMAGNYTSELFSDLAVAADGSIWVCGQSDDSVAGGGDIRRGVLVRWSPTGAVTAAAVGSSMSPAGFQAVTVDPSGNAYVAGSVRRGPFHDGLVARYTPACTRSWSTSVGRMPMTEDLLADIALGPSGSVYAVGELTEQGDDSRGVALRIRR